MPKKRSMEDILKVSEEAMRRILERSEFYAEHSPIMVSNVLAQTFKAYLDSVNFAELHDSLNKTNGHLSTLISEVRALRLDLQQKGPKQ